MYRELRRALRSQGTVAIIMLDVDGFKGINDAHGHPAGDVVLREVAGLLQKNIRAEDVASRYGGDEFVLILPDMSKEIARQRAESLCLAAGRLNIQFEQQTPGPLGLSAGVASFPENGLTGEAILRAADAALYQAKHEARGMVVAAG